MKQLLTLLFLSFSITAISTEISQQQKLELINSIEKRIASNYILQENLDAIHSSLDKVAESDIFRHANDTESVADIIESVLEKHDKHFGVSWHDPESPQQQPKHKDWFGKLSRKNSGITRIEALEEKNRRKSGHRNILKGSISNGL
ncbi:hypothetical protein ACJJIE_20420 [Microbulbifer sp. TRSA001]|uniref:hypothetical protein n=1 Tax=Microbulbifer sp. TRSA001 TaxID=3243381 RepID=UPI0040390D54